MDIFEHLDMWDFLQTHPVYINCLILVWTAKKESAGIRKWSHDSDTTIKGQFTYHIISLVWTVTHRALDLATASLV